MSYSNAIIPIRLTRETDHPKEYLCITGNLFYIGLKKIRQDVTYRGMNLENYREYCLSMGEDAGSIVLPPKVLNARYVMLHNGTNGTLFKLKGAGPRFMSKGTLQKKGFETLGHDYYLVYTFDTAQSKDYNNLSSLGRGKQTTAPWFATWEELMNNDNRYGKRS